jgi:hypothetical protein
MFNAPRQQLILATALVVSLLAVAPEPAQAACKNSGPSINAHKYGSEVTGQSVTICSTAVKVTPARVAVVKQKPATVAKPAPRPQVSASYKKLLKQLGFAGAPKPKLKVIAKPVAKPKATVSKKVIRVAGSTTTNGAAANFTPAGVTARVYPGNTIEVGTQANFVSTPMMHYRAGILQSVPTEVRFTPIAVNWSFDDGQKASGAGVGRSFSDTGTHSVTVSVIYAVAYRVRGSAAWIQEPDQIEMTNQLQLDVVDAGEYSENPELAPEQSAKVLLVGSTCLAKPTAFGC